MGHHQRLPQHGGRALLMEKWERAQNVRRPGPAALGIRCQRLGFCMGHHQRLPRHGGRALLDGEVGARAERAPARACCIGD